MVKEEIWSQKSLNIERFSINSSQKIEIELFSNPPLSLEFTNWSKVTKIDENQVKKTENVIKNS